MAEPAAVRFAREFYSADAVQRAAYRLSDRMSCELQSEPDAYVCIVHPGPGEDELDRLIADFRNEVLDYTLRERIREETRDVRTVILALAFTDTQLVEPT